MRDIAINPFDVHIGEFPYVSMFYIRAASYLDSPREEILILVDRANVARNAKRLS